MANTPRPFVITPYRPDPDGVLVPDMPSEGVCAQPSGTPCRLNVDHRRQRTTGPCFPLTVVRCRAHRSAFTLYPPGHVPYGRVAVAPAAPDGSAIHGEEAFRATVFEAALDAAEGRAWHREHRGATHRWWATQHRRLRLSLKLLGVAPQLPARHRAQVAEVLAIDTLRLNEEAQGLRQGVGYRRRGCAVRRLLKALPAGRFLSERVLECGALAGHWGAPHRWLPETATLRRQPFRGAGIPRARPP